MISFSLLEGKLIDKAKAKLNTPQNKKLALAAGAGAVAGALLRGGGTTVKHFHNHNIIRPSRVVSSYSDDW
jgi:hypothetical protein